MSDFDAWDPGRPSPGFADRVVSRAVAERARRRARRGAAFACAAAIASVGMAFGWLRAGGVDRGAWIAKDRAELRIGRYVTAELDVGARIDWLVDRRGGDAAVTQPAGAVTYRVDGAHAEASTALRVTTSAGAIVTVSGDAKLRVVAREGRDAGPVPRDARGHGDTREPREDRDAMGKREQVVGVTAAVGAAALVVVMAGRATVARGDRRVEVGAGESAIADEDGVRRATGGEGAVGAEPRFAANAKPSWPSHDPAVREAMREQILAALQAPAIAEPAPSAPAPESPPVTTPVTAATSEFEPSYVRDRVREDFMPLGVKCYGDALAIHPTLHGKVIVHFKIVGDEKVGGIVDEASIDDKSTLNDPALSECIRQSMMTVSFKPPPHGGWTTVTYPFIFSPGDGGDEDE